MGAQIWRQFTGDAKRMKTPGELAILQQLFVADRKQRTAQRCKHRQLVFRPLDGGQRGAQGLDLRAIMKRAAADQQMGNAARFERLDVGPRHVLLEADEAAEQQADMARLNRHEMLRLAGPEAPRRSRRQSPLAPPPAVRRFSSRFH